MKTTNLNQPGRRAAVFRNSVGPTDDVQAAGVSDRAGPQATALVRKNEAFADLKRRSGVRNAKSFSSRKQWNPNRILRALMKLVAVFITSQNGLSMASARPAYSKRANPPTLDTLQQCGIDELNFYRANLASQGVDEPEMPMLCVDESTHDRYVNYRTADARTNCYGDAVGLVGRRDPPGLRAGSMDCERLVDGALQDGAVRAKNDACPDFTRKMQFYISEDRQDYHVISRGQADATWMNKYSGTPRFPLAPSGSTEPRQSFRGIIWIVKNRHGEASVVLQRPHDYPIWCPEMLCSLPERTAARKSEL